MQRKNRLAVFEHVPHKDRSKNHGNRNIKRNRSPEPSFEENLTQRNVKRRRKVVKISQEELILNCECEDCNYSTDNYYSLLNHVIEHADFVEDTVDSFQCTWDNCSFTTECPEKLKQHLHFHGYHLKLKNIGSNILSRQKLPECREMIDYKIPNLPICYICEWDCCDTKFKNFQVFVDHIKCHVNSTPKRCKAKGDVIECGWTGCINKFPTQYKLSEHVRCHTKERVVACPTCGVTFSSNTKFYDHRKRQLATDLQGYQCSQCTKRFASERLLRDHMRIHINHYKCHLCDMTCTKPSRLATHIRYRHLPDRLFKCDICSHSTITQQDLINHRKTHSSKYKMECLQCDYKCRSKYAIEKHVKKVHEGKWENKYACHCCEQRFARGALLTKHLIKVHDFHWPSGHSRFSYKQNAKTGLYNLQVVRYESLEVTQEMMQGSAPYQLRKSQGCKYECEQSDEKPFSYVLKLSNKDSASEKITASNNFTSQFVNNFNNNQTKTVPNSSDEVLITIEEVDSKGNIVKLEAVESSKIIYAAEINSDDCKLIA